MGAVSVLRVNAAGLVFFGAYTLVLPHRICARFAPQHIVARGARFPGLGAAIRATDPTESTLAAVRDLLQGWALFSLALGGAAWLLDGVADAAVRRAACALFALVGAASVLWDVKLARAPHWGGGRFFAVNISVNAWLCVGNCLALLESR